MGLQALKIVEAEIERERRCLPSNANAFIVLDRLESRILSRIKRECIEQEEPTVPTCGQCREKPAADRVEVDSGGFEPVREMDLCNDCIELFRAEGYSIIIPCNNPGDSHIDVLYKGTLEDCRDLEDLRDFAHRNDEDFVRPMGVRGNDVNFKGEKTT